MITFNVVKEEHGWAIRMGERMTTPFWSRELAIREANCLADAIRGHGECAEVFVEGTDPDEPLKKIKGSNSSRPDALLRGRGRWAGSQ
jgi:hypothetical protein